MGLQAARAKGRFGGRPKALTAKAEVLARDTHASGKTVTEIAESLRVSRATIYRQLANP